MKSVNGENAPARPGRKRSEGSRLAILAAALELTAEVGYAGLSVDGIAARAGTGKQTIYRWWPSKDDVLLEAVADRAALDVVVPDQGSYRADLQEFLIASFALGRQPQVPGVLRALMARAQIDEEFGHRFRTSFLQRRRDALAVVVERAEARGDLPLTLTRDTVADVVFGVIWYRLLASREPFSDRLAGEIAGALSAPGPQYARPASHLEDSPWPA
jgi:AcrR family transcriptional regulator